LKVETEAAWLCSSVEEEEEEEVLLTAYNKWRGSMRSRRRERKY
jgi:hypothetical protein